MGVCEEPQAVVEECSAAGVVLVVLGEALVHVGEACPDAVLMPFQGRKVDGVGEVRGEQLVALVLEALTVRGQFGQIIAAVVPTEMRVSIVAAPCLRFIQAALWNGQPAHTTTGAASAREAKPQ